MITMSNAKRFRKKGHLAMHVDVSHKTVCIPFNCDLKQSNVDVIVSG